VPGDQASDASSRSRWRPYGHERLVRVVFRCSQPREGAQSETPQLSWRESDNPFNQAPSVGNGSALPAAYAEIRVVDVCVDVSDSARLRVISLPFPATSLAASELVGCGRCSQRLMKTERSDFATAVT
jgi:hypothetical protein